MAKVVGTVKRESWYTLYTRPRAEKKVSEYLEAEGYDCYCPLKKEIRQWKDRKKIIQIPVFPSYVFVRCTESQRERVLQAPGVLNFVFWLGKPAIVKDSEIEAVKNFLSETTDVEVRKMDIEAGSKVLITAGAFRGIEGEVLEHNSRRVILQIQSLGLELRANIHKNKVSIIKKSQ